jgi:hypothetical protein
VSFLQNQSISARDIVDEAKTFPRASKHHVDLLISKTFLQFDTKSKFRVKWRGKSSGRFDEKIDVPASAPIVDAGTEQSHLRVRTEVANGTLEDGRDFLG